MPVRAKATRSTSRRGTPAVASKQSHGRITIAHRRVAPSHRPQAAVKSHPAGPSPFTKAMRFLASLSDYERMRIVRFPCKNFDLDRMRTLLRWLGNPQDKFRTGQAAGTKGKGSTCAMNPAMLQGKVY